VPDSMLLPLWLTESVASPVGLYYAGLLGNRLSIFRTIHRSAHCTADATKDSIRGLLLQSNRSSVVFRCRATRIPATIASTACVPLPSQHRNMFRLVFASKIVLVSCAWQPKKTAGREPYNLSPP
jgi:hypothetical protein